MADILKRVEELSDLFDNKGSERLEFNTAGLVKYNLDRQKTYQGAYTTITNGINTLEETVNSSDFIFLSVPTPSNPDGSMHLGILESVLRDIQVVNKRKDNMTQIKKQKT